MNATEEDNGTIWQQPALEHALAQWALHNRSATARALQMSLTLDDAFPSRWLRASDLGNRDFTVTINAVDMETFDDGTRKPALFFEGAEKGLILNKTNATAIAGEYGNDLEKWIGCKITLFKMKVQGPSGLVDGIRVRIPESKSKPAPAPEVAEDLDDDIPF